MFPAVTASASDSASFSSERKFLNMSLNLCFFRRLHEQALTAMPEAGGVSQMAGVHGFGGAGAGRFAGPGGMMGAGGGAQGEPLRVTIANPNAMKQNVSLVFFSIANRMNDASIYATWLCRALTEIESPLGTVREYLARGVFLTEQE